MKTPRFTVYSPCPPLNPRRPYDDGDPDGYQEGNRDFAGNNPDWLRWCEAHARLIAAAPELLEALKSAPKTAHPSDERGPCLCSSCEWSRNALALIAKAEGRA